MSMVESFGTITQSFSDSEYVLFRIYLIILLLKWSPVLVERYFSPKTIIVLQQQLLPPTGRQLSCQRHTSQFSIIPHLAAPIEAAKTWSTGLRRSSSSMILGFNSKEPGRRLRRIVRM